MHARRAHSGVQGVFVAFDVDFDDTCCARGLDILGGVADEPRSVGANSQCVETGEDAVGAGLSPDAMCGFGDDDGSEMVRAEQGKLGSGDMQRRIGHAPELDAQAAQFRKGADVTERGGATRSAIRSVVSREGRPEQRGIELEVAPNDGITVGSEPEGVDRGLIGVAPQVTQRASNHVVSVLGSGCDEGSIEIEPNGLHRASRRAASTCVMRRWGEKTMERSCTRRSRWCGLRYERGRAYSLWRNHLSRKP